MRIARRWWGIALLSAALVLAIAASISFGTNPLSLSDTWSGFIRKDGTEASIIVWSQRIPRTILGLVTGIAFGMAGALIQALTRNPLADSGILGVNAGAGFAVTIGVSFFGVATAQGMAWWAFVGAAATTVAVWFLGAAAGADSSPVVLILAGIALAAVLNGISTFLSLIAEETFQAVRNWGVGSLSMVDTDDLIAVAPFLAVGVALALLISGPLNSLALGDDLAVALGSRIVVTRVLGVIAITLLAGGATALTGGIAFIGLMVPHIVRWFVGPDQRWIIATSALAAPIVLIIADVIGRVVVRPGEIQAGIVTAVIGAPVLIALVRRRRVSGL